jgi:hypothetical protein
VECKTGLQQQIFIELDFMQDVRKSRYQVSEVSAWASAGLLPGFQSILVPVSFMPLWNPVFLIFGASGNIPAKSRNRQVVENKRQQNSSARNQGSASCF